MSRILFYGFFLSSCVLHALSPVIDTLDKAKEMAKIYDKPIICFFDDALTDGKRAEIAKEYFSHPSIYTPFSSTHIFTHCRNGKKGVSGFMVLSKSGDVLANITTYNDFNKLADSISKCSFLN